MSQEEKQGYAQQVIAALRELRQFTLPVPRRVDGSSLWDNIIGQCAGAQNRKNIGKTKEEWFWNMDEELRVGLSRNLKTEDKDIIEARLQELKGNFPDGAPYVLTHAYLNSSNIIVNDGKIETIIDWELAGYSPWWVERWASLTRAISEAADELFDMVWAELDPDLDRVQFIQKVAERVTPVSSAWAILPRGTHRVPRYLAAHKVL